MKLSLLTLSAAMTVSTFAFADNDVAMYDEVYHRNIDAGLNDAASSDVAMYDDAYSSLPGNTPEFNVNLLPATAAAPLKELEDCGS